jgi:hypothetical protein
VEILAPCIKDKCLKIEEFASCAQCKIDQLSGNSGVRGAVEKVVDATNAQNQNMTEECSQVGIQNVTVPRLHTGSGSGSAPAVAAGSFFVAVGVAVAALL